MPSFAALDPLCYKQPRPQAAPPRANAHHGSDMGWFSQVNLQDLLAQLDEMDSLASLQPYWEESMAALGDQTPPFLRPAAVLENRDWCALPPELDSILLHAAGRIAADPALRRLAWHCHALLYDHTDYRDEIKRWPSLRQALGELSGAFYLLICMAVAERVRAVHRAMGVSEDVTRETCSAVAAMVARYRREPGHPLGVHLSTAYWLRHHAAGRLFRLGRMEYMIRPSSGNVEVYRRREDGAVIALARDGLRYNRDGYMDARGDATGEQDGWTATLVADGKTITGYPISPYGMAIRRQVQLESALWELVFRQGDAVLEMHIPDGGGMSLDRCIDSMRRAAPFFQHYFPAEPFKAIVCGSWILNNQLQDIPLSSDNLARFQRELYLHPVPSNGRDGLWFIFLQDPVDPATAPRNTSLRRAVADFLAAGNTWRGGGMFFLVEHLDHLGTQYYRSHWPPAGLGLGAIGQETKGR